MASKFGCCPSWTVSIILTLHKHNSLPLGLKHPSTFTQEYLRAMILKVPKVPFIIVMIGIFGNKESLGLLPIWIRSQSDQIGRYFGTPLKNFGHFEAFIEYLPLFWANFFQILYVIGRFFIVVNCKILKKHCSHLVTLSTLNNQFQPPTIYLKN